jgi:FkbM family methyltransferase
VNAAALRYYANRPFAKLWRMLCPDVIVQREIRGVLFSVSMRDHALWVFRGTFADAEFLPIPRGSRVWDLGCNIGLYSVQAAQIGCVVTAFDISKTNTLCLDQTARVNGLAIRAIHSPVTVDPVWWTPSRNGHTESELQVGGSLRSITYTEAAQMYGVPKFIKMDIQGGEIPFLRSVAFRDWAIQNSVTIYLEAHDDAAKHIWNDFRQIGPIHYLLEAGKSQSK